jgi:hypothetical protein
MGCRNLGIVVSMSFSPGFSPQNYLHVQHMDNRLMRIQPENTTTKIKHASRGWFESATISLMERRTNAQHLYDHLVHTQKLYSTSSYESLLFSFRWKCISAFPKEQMSKHMTSVLEVLNSATKTIIAIQNRAQLNHMSLDLELGLGSSHLAQ